MSPQFIRDIRTVLKCRCCNSVPAEQRKFCPAHLEYARLKWRAHAAECKEQGRCLECPKKRLQDNCRCSKHREKNRVKCLAWTRAHPEHSRQGWERRKKLIAAGICICRKHNPLPAGFHRCDECRARRRAQKKNSRMSKKG